MRLAAVVAALALLQGASTERRISAYITAHNREAIALLQRVVDINSGTQNLSGVRQVGTVFRAELDRLGFKTTWIDGASFHRAGHLVAEHPGRGPKILLIGHLDTVFERDSPFQKFELLDERTARGPGVIDMKGGDVIIVRALAALNAVGALDAMNVVVVMTGDEEDAGRPLAKAREALVAAARGAEYAVGFEDGPGDPQYAVTARRGTSEWELRVTGTAAHSSQIFRPEVGSGAIFEAARILDGFRARLAAEAHVTFNPGVILGGTAVDYDAQQQRGSASGKTNVVAGRAVVNGDLRTLTRDQLERAKRTMHEVVASTLPHTKATLAFDDGYPPLAPTEGNARLLSMYDRVSQDLGFGRVVAVSPDKAGAADVSFVADEVTMILDGVGLMGRDDHTSAETADLRTLPSQTMRAAITIYRLGNARGSRVKAQR